MSDQEEQNHDLRLGAAGLIDSALATARSDTEITHAAMADFYRELWGEAEADRAALSKPAWSGTAAELDALIDSMD